MKKIFAILLLTSITYAASAQHGKHRQPVRNSHTVIRPQVRIGVGSSFGNGYGYNRTSPFYSSPYNSYNYNRPSRLDLQIQDIENDYRDRKWSVRNDKSLSRQQRKAELQNLKYQKEREIIELRRNYNKSRY